MFVLIEKFPEVALFLFMILFLTEDRGLSCFL